MKPAGPAERARILAHLPRLTEEEIEAGRSPRGGWTREQLAAWGVPWPPPRDEAGPALRHRRQR